MSLTKDQANTDSTTEKAAEQADALTRYVADADALIQNAIDQGKFHATTYSYDPNLVPTDVIDYYTALGYKVGFPDYLNNLALQPAQLFGEFWVNFWSGVQAPNPVTLPLKITLNWE